MAFIHEQGKIVSQIAARQNNLVVDVNLGYSLACLYFSGRPMNFGTVGYAFAAFYITYFKTLLYIA